MKKTLALVLAIVMLLTAIVTVSAADTTTTGDAAAAGIQNFEFEETDARNMFDNQVIYIDRIAGVDPIQDGDVGVTEYTTKVSINHWSNPDNKADAYFAYKDGYLYFAVVKAGVAEAYTVQIDMGNAAENHPYSVAADRVSQQIKAGGAVANASYGFWRDDSKAGWGVLGDHPWKAEGISTNYIEPGAFNGIVDGNLVIEAKVNVLSLIKVFAAATQYRTADTEYASQALSFGIWMDNVSNQFVAKGDYTAYKKVDAWKNITIDWNWVMHTIVLPEKPASRYIAKEPAGEMVWETPFDARNIFADKGQVMTISKIAEKLPTLDGIVGTGEYTDKFPLYIYNNPDRKAEVSMSYKDGYLYMGVVMPAGAAIKTQVDMGIGESNSPYITVNRTTHQINADGSLGGSGQLIRCDDAADWNVRGTHPSGGGAYFIDKAATSYADGFMTFEYVVDTVRLIKWFATHEAYYDWDTTIATRIVCWQIWGAKADDATAGVEAQYCVASMAAMLSLNWPSQTIGWNWAKHTIVLPEAPASHLEKYVEPPYDADANLNKLDPSTKKWNELVYTVDFSEKDGYFDGSYLNKSNGQWTITPTEDGKGITVKGKGGTSSGSYFWGGVIGGLDVDYKSYYTMVYKAKANGDVGKNNSLNVGAWIPEGKAHALKHYGVYTNHNTNADNRGVVGIGSGKGKDSEYTMFSKLPAKWAQDTDGFMTMMIEYDAIDGMMYCYYLAEGKTGQAKEDWVLIKSNALPAAEGDMLGFELYGCYDVIDSTIKDVQIWKGTYYPSTEKIWEPPTTEAPTTEAPTTEAPTEEITTVAPGSSEDTTTVVTPGSSDENTTTATPGSSEETTTAKTPAATSGTTSGGDDAGCKSSVVSGMVVLAIIGCGAVVASKKRK